MAKRRQDLTKRVSDEIARRLKKTSIIELDLLVKTRNKSDELTLGSVGICYSRDL